MTERQRCTIHGSLSASVCTITWYVCTVPSHSQTLVECCNHIYIYLATRSHIFIRPYCREKKSLMVSIREVWSLAESAYESVRACTRAPAPHLLHIRSLHTRTAHLPSWPGRVARASDRLSISKRARLERALSHSRLTYDTTR